MSGGCLGRRRRRCIGGGRRRRVARETGRGSLRPWGSRTRGGTPMKWVALVAVVVAVVGCGGGGGGDLAELPAWIPPPDYQYPYEWYGMPPAPVREDPAL